MKIKLVLQKSEWDGANVTYTATRIFDVDVPLDKQDGWQVTGAVWPEKEENAQ